MQPSRLFHVACVAVTTRCTGRAGRCEWSVPRPSRGSDVRVTARPVPRGRAAGQARAVFIYVERVLTLAPQLWDSHAQVGRCRLGRGGRGFEWRALGG